LRIEYQEEALISLTKILTKNLKSLSLEIFEISSRDKASASVDSFKKLFETLKNCSLIQLSFKLMVWHDESIEDSEIIFMDLTTILKHLTHLKSLKLLFATVKRIDFLAVKLSLQLQQLEDLEGSLY